MYATCLFCHSRLGRNESIEDFPVGRRLAFDAAKGRLWVVCVACGRWNLTPLEERWEAIETCERLFRATRVRVTTAQIGLARLPEGCELVRIGAPLRPEFAAWRYGTRFARRRARAQMAAGAAVVAAGAGAIAFARVLTVRAKHVRSTELHVRGRDPTAVSLDVPHDDGWAHFDGLEAMQAASILLAGTNHFGAPAARVQDAVNRVEESGDAATYLRAASSIGDARNSRMTSLLNLWRHLGAMRLSSTECLALEMALHEESERRALDGELALLEAAWRDADEIARVADTL